MKYLPKILISMVVLGGLLVPSAALSQEGLQVSILKTVINDSLQAEVEFTLRDDRGNPLWLDDVSIQGFILARLDVLNPMSGSAVYTSYSTRLQTVPEGAPNAGNSAIQATYDSGGEFIFIENGKYKYVFGTVLPIGFDRSKTHTVSAQMERTVGEKRFVANPLFHFVPNGSDVVELRKVVTTESCNTCHTSLGIHGGGRKEVGLCITCHSPQSTDSDTGNSVDMTEMIHKIHMGANLPSVQAGEPYQIVGFRQSVHDYSEVHLPQDIRNCQTCHTGPQADVYKTAPSRRACGSCHDDVNFMTGAGHGPGIPQLDDSSCTNCHQPDGDEFGLSVAGAHTIPFKSNKLKGINIEIVEVVNAVAGQTPIVRFNITRDDGTPVSPAEFRTFTIRIAGPTEDFTHYISENAIAGSAPDGDGFMYAFTEPIPAGAEGTYTVTIDNRKDEILIDNPEGEDDLTVTVSGDNPIFHVNVDGEAPIARRQIVDIAKCNQCHDRINFHGGQRNQIENCATCHNPKTGDSLDRRIAEGADGGVSISLGLMIHKIHTGVNLNQDYTIFRSRSIFNFNDINFPGLVQDCKMCHIDDPALPLPETNEIVEFGLVSGEHVSTPAASSSCTSCHDMRDAVAHASLNTTMDGIESCAVCHREGRISSITQAHTLNVSLNVIERTSADATSIQQWLLHQ